MMYWNEELETLAWPEVERWQDTLGDLALQIGVTDARADIVVRATGDNPAVDVEAPARLVHWLVSRGVEYVAERGLPYGAAVEAMTIEALCRADQLATIVGVDRPDDYADVDFNFKDDAE